MRILWLSKTPGLYPQNGINIGYNGGGWISSLQKLVLNNSEIELGFVFISPQKQECKRCCKCTYFPIESHKLTATKKIARYYGLTKNTDISYISEVLSIITSFSPDLIHVFGFENEMIDIVHYTEIPVVVHLQGLLGPTGNAFWPIDFNALSFFWPFSSREWIFRNGYRYEKADILRRGRIEGQIFSKLCYVMGRTEWDKQITNLLSPLCKYYHVDEVLRDSFYKHSGEWVMPNKKLIIASTISDTMYKGFDLIMKAAKILKERTDVNFEWHIIGIRKTTRIIKFFENKFGYSANSVGISFCGILSESQLCQKLLQSSLFVHPSYIDNSPNSVCEAQLLGLPVIACNVGGVSSLIEHKETGILIPANAPYELAYWIKEFENNKQLMLKLGKGGYSVASARHDRTIIIETLLNCYKSIISRNL